MKPRIIIVDEKDNLVGHKERDDRNVKNIYRVSALWVTNDRGDVLLARRAFSKVHDPGKWGPAVSGTVEEGETYDSNIIKEAAEEIGIKDVNFQKGSKERVSGEYNFFCQWYVLNLDKPAGEFVIDRSEVEEIRWFSKEELLEKIQNDPDMFLEMTQRWAALFCKK